MKDDTVRHLWSDAELDEALAALHPHEATNDRTELDRARASLMRAAVAVSESDEPAVPQRKKRSGSWRWIAVAAAVAVLTGGVVVVRELASAPTTLAPAGPGSADRRDADAPFTHVVTKYRRIAWVSGRSAFTIREQLDLWIPANPAGTWKGRWTRSSPPELVTGKERDSVDLPGPSQYEESAPGGRFTQNLPYAGRLPDTTPPGWYRPTPEFVASLPANPNQLLARLLTDLNTPQAPQGDGPLPQPTNYSGTAQFPSRIVYPASVEMILNVFTSEYASRELRAALLNMMEMPQFNFAPVWKDSDTAQYTTSTGLYNVLVSVDRTRAQLTDVQVTARNKTAGLSPGTPVSSAQFSYETTDRAGN